MKLVASGFVPPSASGGRLRRVVFWEPGLSPHKAGLFASFARAMPELEVLACSHYGVGVERTRLGWVAPQAKGYVSVEAPTEAQIAAIVAESPATTLHVFSGIRWVPSIVTALREVRRHGARFGIMSEPRVKEGWRGKLRLLQSWATEGWLRRHASFVLAIGRNGPDWFTAAGYAPQRVLPFAYFVDPPALPEVAGAPDADEPLRIGFLGRLVSAKGVADLIVACSQLQRPCVLELAGAGAEQGAFETLARQHGVAARFLGAIPITRVGDFLARVDVLVLASTTSDDGWGVAASEALMAGASVVLSRQVGASLIVTHPDLGRVVDAHAPGQIAQALADCGRPRMRSAAMRARRAAWGRAMLSADHGAASLRAVVRWIEGQGPRPRPFFEAASTALAEAPVVTP